jgi:protein-arginine kinase activator protein McsA
MREERRQLRQLRAELERAIRHEDYEAAAVLRDRIGGLERSAEERSKEQR